MCTGTFYWVILLRRSVLIREHNEMGLRDEVAPIYDWRLGLS